MQVLNNGTSVLGGGLEGETIYLGHLKNFFEINDETSVEVGSSYMFGDNGSGNGAKSHVSGVDVTMKWQPEQYNTWTSQTEAFLVKKNRP